MNKKQFITLFCVVAFLLISGWLLFQLLNRGVIFDLEDAGFQTWVWEKRSMDLAVQVFLVFAGALGIAAILPIEDEEND